MDLAKRDLSVTRGGRAFRVRAYLDNQDPLGVGWHTIIVENRTPVSHELPITPDLETCLRAAVRFVDDAVAADAMRGDVERDQGHVHAWESEGGASARDRSHDPIGAPPIEVAQYLFLEESQRQ